MPSPAGQRSQQRRIGLGKRNDHRGGVRIGDRRQIAYVVDVRHLVGHVLLQRPHGVRASNVWPFEKVTPDCSVRVTVSPSSEVFQLVASPAEACCLDRRSLMSHTLSTSRRSAAAEESDRISKDCGISSMPMVTSASRDDPGWNRFCMNVHPTTTSAPSATGDSEKIPTWTMYCPACCAAWFSV